MRFLSLLKAWLLSFLGWGIFVLATAGQITFATTIPWADALYYAARDWLPWALITPGIFAFTRRLPIERGTWRLAVPAHLVACVVSLLFCGWIAMLAGPLMPETRARGPFPREGRPPRNQVTPPLERAPLSAPETAPPNRPPSVRGPGRGGPPPFFRGVALWRFGFQFPIYWLMASVAHAFVFYRRAQERERRALELSASLAQARLAALKMQLQPHFLFNSLNAIAALVHKDPEAADEMLAALSDFLRLTLESSGEQEVPLRREIEFVERYLSIEQVRFGDRLRVVIDLAPDTATALVPALILQPLVENAVRHGIEPRPGPGRIEIRAWRDGDELFLAVSDDGAGLSAEGPVREGVGITNTRARLQELHGDRARLEMRNSGRGLVVEIALPYRPAS